MIPRAITTGITTATMTAAANVTANVTATATAIRLSGKADRGRLYSYGQGAVDKSELSQQVNNNNATRPDHSLGYQAVVNT